MRRHPLYEPERLLNGTLGFTDEDLAANRNGLLTDRQLKHLNREQARWAFLIPVAITGCLLGVVLLQPKDSMTGIMLIGVSIVAIIYGWHKIRSLRWDFRDGEVGVIRGQIEVGEITFRARGSAGYYLRLNGMKWRIRESPFLAFASGEPYAIYYAPHSKTLLSAEWLGRSDMPS